MFPPFDNQRSISLAQIFRGRFSCDTAIASVFAEGSKSQIQRLRERRAKIWGTYCLRERRRKKRKNRGEDGQAGLVQAERRSLRQSRLRYLRVLGHPWTSVRFLFGVEGGLQWFRRVGSKLGGQEGRKQERGKGQGQRGGRDRNRVRDLGAKEADEEADALGLVSRIMVILKASERQECHSRFLKAIFSTREWLTRGCAYVYRTPR